MVQLWVKNYDILLQNLGPETTLNMLVTFKLCVVNSAHEILGIYHIGEQWRLRRACAPGSLIRAFADCINKVWKKREKGDQTLDIEPAGFASMGVQWNKNLSQM